MRCLTLATTLRERGAVVSFVSCQHAGHLSSLILDRGFEVARLPLRPVVPQLASPYAGWLGGTWEDDADETAAAIARLEEMPDWLVVDHYGIDRRWEQRLRASSRRIMVIDDLADREHDCDILLDQNLVACMDTRYTNKVPDECALMLGPTFAMLQPAYGELHHRAPPRSGDVQHILIAFGGTDAGNLTGRALAAVLGLGNDAIAVDVVLGATNSHVASLRRQANGHANVAIHTGLPSLAPLMLKADLAVGAAGATSWERLCLGLPSIIIAAAENQIAIAEALSGRGLAQSLGPADHVTDSAVVAALRNVIERGLSEDWSRRCLDVVDGRGVERVSAALTVTSDTVLRARPAALTDEGLLLEWANDPATRRNAFSGAFIKATEHRAWFHARLRDITNSRIYIVETGDGIPVGQVRFDREGDAWRISYALAPQFRGRRLGRSILTVALLELARTEVGATLVASVKSTNRASQRVFESLGFTASAHGDVIQYNSSGARA
jgi:UDP-2,4-diacetamido-2,4,6-trideoxy-beta-L-altropyranose hydrolase